MLNCVCDSMDQCQDPTLPTAKEFVGNLTWAAIQASWDLGYCSYYVGLPPRCAGKCGVRISKKKLAICFYW